MPNTNDVHRSLPAHLIHRSVKDDAIAYLAAADLPAATRRSIYRAWCKATMSSCRPEDLARVAPGKPREHCGVLFGDLGGPPRKVRRPRRAAIVTEPVK